MLLSSFVFWKFIWVFGLYTLLNTSFKTTRLAICYILILVFSLLVKPCFTPSFWSYSFSNSICVNRNAFCWLYLLFPLCDIFARFVFTITIIVFRSFCWYFFTTCSKIGLPKIFHFFPFVTYPFPWRYSTLMSSPFVELSFWYPSLHSIIILTIMKAPLTKFWLSKSTLPDTSTTRTFLSYNSSSPP